jgi:hypothetical protein
MNRKYLIIQSIQILEKNRSSSFAYTWLWSCNCDNQALSTQFGGFAISEISFNGSLRSCVCMWGQSKLMLSLPNSPSSRPSFSLLVPTLFALLKQTLKTIKLVLKPLINPDATSYFSKNTAFSYQQKLITFFFWNILITKYVLYYNYLILYFSMIFVKFIIILSFVDFNEVIFYTIFCLETCVYPEKNFITIL